MIEFGIGVALVMLGSFILWKAKASGGIAKMSDGLSQVLVMVVIMMLLGGVALMIHAFTG